MTYISYDGQFIGGHYSSFVSQVSNWCRIILSYSYLCKKERRQKDPLMVLNYHENGRRWNFLWKWRILNVSINYKACANFESIWASMVHLFRFQFCAEGNWTCHLGRVYFCLGKTARSKIWTVKEDFGFFSIIFHGCTSASLYFCFKSVTYFQWFKYY